MNQEYKLYRISQLLARFSEQVKILNSNSEFGINIHAENILIKLLNTIYGSDLKNVNYEEGKNYPSIDLRDTQKRIAIQVTSTANLHKIKDTLKKFVDNKLYQDFDSVRIFIITEKQTTYDFTSINKIIDGRFSFSVSDIVDKKDLYLELNKQNDIDKIDRFSLLLEEQFSDNESELNRWNSYCRGLSDYDKYVISRYHFLDIKGFSPKINNTLVKLELNKIYVPLELVSNLQEETDFDRQEVIKNYSIENALLNFSNLVILGDPGSGKSTLLKKLAFNICNSRQASDLVPVLIKGSEFAKFVKDSSKGLAEYIINHIDKKYEDLFASKLEENKLLVLVDGIDEINQYDLKHCVSDRVNSFIAHYPKAKIVVSSRIVGYKENCLNGYFTHLNVSRFKKKQIKQFVENWYQALSNSSGENTDQAKELFQSICKNQSVLKMASNPLLVTIIALIHYQGSTLPERRAALYDIATSTLLDNWVKQRNIGNKSIIDKDTLIELLSPIAFFIHVNNTTGLISESNLKEKLIKEYKVINPYSSTSETKRDIKDIVDFLREDAGFLFEKGTNSDGESMFGFVHQTFQEYFTAIELKTKWKEGWASKELKEITLDSNWHEVIKLTASLFKHSEQTRVGRKDTTLFIKEIFEFEDTVPEMYRPLKLVVSILEENTEVDLIFFEQVFDNIIECARNSNSDNDFHSNFVNFNILLSKLLTTKVYRKYALSQIIKIIHAEQKDNPWFVRKLISILMSKSEEEEVQSELNIILNGNNVELKEYLFIHNVIFPASNIVETELFRDEVIKYVNSDCYLGKYSNYLPTQYMVCHEGGQRSRRLSSLSNDECVVETEVDLYLSAIEHVENTRLKQILISDCSGNVSCFSLKSLKFYRSRLKADYSDFDLMNIEKRIKVLEARSKYCLDQINIAEYRGVKVYKCLDRRDVFAFVKDGEIERYTYPFNKSELACIGGSDADSFFIFLDLILPAYCNDDVRINIDSLELLLVFIKHSDRWGVKHDIDIEAVKVFALSKLFDSECNVNEIINRWLKTIFLNRYLFNNSVSLNNDCDMRIIINNINKSELPAYNKLYLHCLLDCDFNKELLLKEAVFDYQNTKVKMERKNMGDIIKRLL